MMPSITTIAAWSGLLLGLINLTLAMRRWQFDRGNVEPEISIHYDEASFRRDPTSRDGAWLLISLRMRNVDRYSRTIERVTCTSLPDCFLADENMLWDGNIYSYADLHFKGLPAERRVRFLDLNLKAEPAGSSSGSGHPTDDVTADIYIFIADDTPAAFTANWGKLKFQAEVSSGSPMRGRKKISSTINMPALTTFKSSPA